MNANTPLVIITVATVMAHLPNTGAFSFVTMQGGFKPLGVVGDDAGHDLTIEANDDALLQTRSKYFIAFIARSQPILEIGYGRLDPRFYRARGSNHIYGESDLRLTLGCMLPASLGIEERNTERHRLKWRKDGNLEICDSKQLPLACEWDDYFFDRGANVLSIQLEAYDDPANAFLGPGTYTCYYYDNQHNATSSAVSARVWVAGKYMEIKVNGALSQNRSYQLPTTSSDSANPYVLECIIGAGLRYGPQNVKWYRDGNLITASSKYGLNETGRKLEINGANGKDEGVYMCEAEINSRIYGSTSLQYVVLHGEDVTSAAVGRNHWTWWSLLAYALALVQVRHLISKR